MWIVVNTLNALIIFLIRLYYDDLQRSQLARNFTAIENFTLENLIPISLLESWMENATQKDIGKIPITRKLHKDSKEGITIEECLKSNRSCVDNSLKTFIDAANKSSELEPELERYIETLFNPPSEMVIPDWDIVTGSWTFYDEENWGNFLTGVGASIFWRMLVENVAETITVTAERKKYKKNRKKFQSTKSENSPENFETRCWATVWFISYEVTCRLNEKISVVDPVDGTVSEDNIFFLTPRLGVCTKHKLDHRVAILGHFDETTLNVTFFDRDILAMATRFYRRVDETQGFEYSLKTGKQSTKRNTRKQ
ncbi:UNVERIFIED_CONTAM: hypothetical protein RMT77_010164 [Armadillidium vulgare]